MAGFLLDLVETNADTIATLRNRYEEPGGAGEGKEDGSEEKTVVISKLGNCGRGGERSGGTSDFVEDVLEVRRLDERQEVVNVTHDGSVHPPQLSNMPTNDITWTEEECISERAQGTRGWGSHHTADKFHHSVGNTTKSPDGEDLQHSISPGYGWKMRVDNVRRLESSRRNEPGRS